MKLLTKVEIQKLSFPDCIVEEMSFDILNRIAKIKTNFAYLFINGGIRLKECKLTVKDWYSIRVSLYQTKTKQWKNLDLDKIENLVDICEFELGEKIIFRGFGVTTGQWIEISFLKASLEVLCD